MTKEERISYLTEKANAINEVGTVVAKYQRNVENIHYEVYGAEVEGYDGNPVYATNEFLVIEYNGGAKTIRSCNANSFSANFMEIARYLDSGYYNEKDYYDEVVSKKERII